MSISCGEIFILSKISDLATRYGLSPLDADVTLHFCAPKFGECHYTLSGLGGSATTEIDQKKAEKMFCLLGIENDKIRRFDTLRDIEKVVDVALSLAPRVRHR